MTENTNINHRAPLAPGEIRTHRVGARVFKVMHVSGGSFTQASVRPDGEPATVLLTDMSTRAAVNAYADAIEQAESDAIDALEGDDTPEPLTDSEAEALAVRAGFAPTPRGLWPVPQDRSADGVPEVEQAHAPAPTTQQRDCPACDCGRRQRGGSHLPTCAIVLWEAKQIEAHEPAPAPTLADDAAALRHMINTEVRPTRRDAFLARLDRIAARVPQRATAYGLELWQHACGVVDHAGPVQPHPDQCDNCRRFRPLTSDPWHPLYVLPDGA
jgi:hypothetical protein